MRSSEHPVALALLPEIHGNAGRRIDLRLPACTAELVGVRGHARRHPWPSSAASTPRTSMGCRALAGCRRCCPADVLLPLPHHVRRLRHRRVRHPQLPQVVQRTSTTSSRPEPNQSRSFKWHRCLGNIFNTFRGTFRVLIFIQL